MHILGLLLAAVVGAGFWYWRLHAAKSAVDDVVDHAGRLHGAYKRRRFRRKAEASTLSGIDEPALGAAVLFVSLLEARGPVGAADEAAIDGWLRDVAGYDSTTEALTFARWASRETVEGNDVVRRLLPLFNSRLSPSEKEDLLAFAGDLARRAGEIEPPQKEMLRRLRSGLLPPN
ncbi:MAG: hypothetical protein J0H54_07715 [Rhizobiales bacterium]|nr:hypothetical protein [Hyphomicrobiales bacterium]